MPDPDELRSLGKRLDNVGRPPEPRRNEAPSAGLATAFRFVTELAVAVAVGVGVGWALDRWLHTRPIFLLVMFVLGAAAGILNIIRAAREINAKQAGSQASNEDDKES